jgi:hypothetical protein
MWAIIVTHDSIQDIFKYCNDTKKTLILSDLDNTLEEPEAIDQVGSDQWFSAAVQYIKDKKNISILDAVYKILPLYYKIHENLVLKPVETETTVLVINKLKEKHVFMGLTSRSLPMVGITIERLSNIGISFSCETKTFQKKLSIDTARLDKGILFCGNNGKDESLSELLNILDVKSERIIFIDDKYANVEKLEKIFQSRKDIEFIGIHYTYLKSKVESFVLDEKSKEVLDQLS